MAFHCFPILLVLWECYTVCFDLVYPFSKLLWDPDPLPTYTFSFIICKICCCIYALGYRAYHWNLITTPTDMPLQKAPFLSFCLSISLSLSIHPPIYLISTYFLIYLCIYHLPIIHPLSLFVRPPPPRYLSIPIWLR